MLIVPEANEDECLPYCIASRVGGGLLLWVRLFLKRAAIRHVTCTNAQALQAAFACLRKSVLKAKQNLLGHECRCRPGCHTRGLATSRKDHGHTARVVPCAETRTANCSDCQLESCVVGLVYGGTTALVVY